jgi:preprotein translocase subunit SecG
MVVGGRQATTLLTKASWICGGLFLFLALIISLVAPSGGASGSEVLERIRQNTPATAPASIPLEQAPAPAATPTPAPATPAAPGN